MTEREDPQGHLARWWLYQRERFPLAAHAPLVAAMSLAALGHGQAAAGAGFAGWQPWLAAWLGLLAFFFLLRVADEFKDYDTDCRHRPYRPLPRGLISRPGLARAGGLAALTTVALALGTGPAVWWPLALVFAWWALMSLEFFVPAWLARRPVLYLFSHMAIMPLLMLYALAHRPAGLDGLSLADLAPLLGVALGTGLCLEIGRKLRRPADEEAGVETYSALWGPGRAALAWLAAVLATLGVALIALAAAPMTLVAPLLLALAVTAGALVGAYRRAPDGPAAPGFETLSALVILVLYLLLGALPWLN